MAKKRKTVTVGGKRFKRVKTAHSFDQATHVAKQRRKKGNVRVTVRRDDSADSYGIYERKER